MKPVPTPTNTRPGASCTNVAMAVALVITCRNVGSSSGPYIEPVTTDLRGRFDFEGLLTGEYELSMTAAVVGVPLSRQRVAKQTVSIVNGKETEVTFVIDLNER